MELSPCLGRILSLRELVCPSPLNYLPIWEEEAFSFSSKRVWGSEVPMVKGNSSPIIGVLWIKHLDQARLWSFLQFLLQRYHQLLSLWKIFAGSCLQFLPARSPWEASHWERRFTLGSLSTLKSTRVLHPDPTTLLLWLTRCWKWKLGGPDILELSASRMDLHLMRTSLRKGYMVLRL